MEKKHPLYIEQLSKDIKIARDLEQKAKDEAKHYGKLWLELSIERAKYCPHEYPDGTSAWKHHYSYSGCEICGENDL